MSAARHVQTTDDRKVLAYGHVRDGEMHLRLACPWCRRVLVSGREPARHATCPSCERKHFSGRITRYRVLQAMEAYGLACEERGQASGPEDMHVASREVTCAHLRAHELLDRYVGQEVKRAREER